MLESVGVPYENQNRVAAGKETRTLDSLLRFQEGNRNQRYDVFVLFPFSFKC